MSRRQLLLSPWRGRVGPALYPGAVLHGAGYHNLPGGLTRASIARCWEARHHEDCFVGVPWVVRRRAIRLLGIQHDISFSLGISEACKTCGERIALHLHLSAHISDLIPNHLSVGRKLLKDDYLRLIYRGIFVKIHRVHRDMPLLMRYRHVFGSSMPVDLR